MPEELPVLIAGAGPTGLMLAGELARYGVACRLVDKRPGPGIYSRALAVQARTLEIFSHLGMTDDLLPRGVRGHGMSMYAGRNRLLHFAIDELDSPFPFVLLTPQTETEAVLTARLGRLGPTPEWTTELTAFTNDVAGVSATLRRPDGGEETVRARWLVGCDGAHSIVRKASGLSFHGETYEAGFALADVRIDWELPHDEVLAFPGEGGLIAAFPIPGEKMYRLTWQVEEATKQGADDPIRHGITADKPAPTLADVQRVLDERVAFPATASHPTWLANYRVNSRMATSYRNGRVFLAGDAAHIHSPAGGQGMNTGLQDVFNLAWKLALVEQGRAKPELLDTYPPERHAVGVELLRNTDRLTGLVMLRHPVATAVRNMAMTYLASTEVVQQRARRTVSELAVGYRKSPLSAEHHGGLLGAVLPHGAGQPGVLAWRDFAAGPHAGDRAPDAPITAGGAPGHLFDLLRDPRRFTLLLFAGRDATPEGVARLTELAGRVTSEWGDAVCPTVVLPGTASLPGVVGDPDHVAHDKYGARAACLYLLRPDGYVGFRSQPADGERLNEYLQTWLVR